MSGRRGAALVVLLLGLPACEAGPFSFGPACEETEMEAKPVDAARIEDVVLEARLTTNGEGVGEAPIDFVWYSTPEGDGADWVETMRAVTGGDGVARLPMTANAAFQALREKARRTRSYRASFTSLLDEYCSAADRAPFRVREP